MKGGERPLATIEDLRRQDYFVNSRSSVQIRVSAPLPKRETIAGTLDMGPAVGRLQPRAPLELVSCESMSGACCWGPSSPCGHTSPTTSVIGDGRSRSRASRKAGVAPGAECTGRTWKVGAIMSPCVQGRRDGSRRARYVSFTLPCAAKRRLQHQSRPGRVMRHRRPVKPGWREEVCSWEPSVAGSDDR
jgi:hypothetical protein